MPIEHPSYPFKARTADSVGPRIVVGPDVHDIEVPRVDSALAEELVVDAANPWYATDGVCLFSKDKTTLIRCLVRVEGYDVPPTCTRIDQEAFAYNTVIRRVSFHEGVTCIGDRAFICTTLDAVEIPGSVRTVGADAFAEGKNLRRVEMAEGVGEIGDRAFADCEGLEEVVIPASVSEIGKDAFVRCKASAHGEHRGLALAPGNARYFIDGSGVLYSREGSGLALVSALDHIVGAYEVLEGTVRIMGRAFAFNRKMERVSFPDSLKIIGKQAFLECDHLTRADLPQGLRTLGAEAFYHTALETITLPSTLDELGPASLIVNIQIASQSPQTGVGGRGASDFYQTALSGRLHEVTVPHFNVSVAPGNPRYTLDGGFLCEHDGQTGELQAVQFVGGGDVATVPRDVTRIAEYALFGVENIRELRLHTGIQKIGHSALALSYPLDLIQVDDGEPVPVRLYPAPNSSGTMAQRKAFRAGWLDLDQLVRDCDASLSFMMPGNERTTRMLARLVNDRRLADNRKREFAVTVRICLDELVRQFARVGNRQGTLALLDLDFIDAGSIAHAIEVANSARGVAIARLLLEEKRVRFPDHALDFDL